MSNVIHTSYIGRIPVRNIWLLYLYASELYKYSDFKYSSFEDNPDDIPNLVAEMLVSSVENRIKRNLSLGYHTHHAVISRVKGRIDHLTTIRRRLLERGMVACFFDELTIDTPRNRIVRLALEKISNVVTNYDLAYKCKYLALCFQRAGVSSTSHHNYHMLNDRFGRHDVIDKPMVTTAYLALNIALPTEQSGIKQIYSPEKEIVWVRKLFEKAVAGFYKFKLTNSDWTVHAGKKVYWQVENPTNGISEVLPSMITDIVLEDKKTNKRVIIDTKFNKIYTSSQHRANVIRSVYLYQIFSYLRSQEKQNDTLSLSSTGMLLHPAVDRMVHESVTIQGHDIHFATLNLAGSAEEIRKELFDLITIVSTDQIINTVPVQVRNPT